jgi:hypothetical protein
VLGLVAAILCVTLILLPLGIPMLMLSRRLFTQAVRLMLPRAMAHPAKALGDSAQRKTGKAAKTVRGRGRKAVSETDAVVPDRVSKTAKRTRKVLRRRRKHFT